MTATEIQLAIPTAYELARALFKRSRHQRWAAASPAEKELFLRAGEAAVHVLRDRPNPYLPEGYAELVERNEGDKDAGR